MHTIPVQVSQVATYEILIDRGLRSQLYPVIQECLPFANEFYILADKTVANLYEADLLESFEKKNVRTRLISFHSGEDSKSHQEYVSIIDQLVELDVKRRSVLVVVGGGVAMDLGGFVGATFMRGMPLVNVPTSLVAQLDAAVGGKVAINHRRGKNLVGAFYNPKLVVADLDFLSTLGNEHISEGLAEAIKAAVIGSPPLFQLIEAETKYTRTSNTEFFEDLIKLACKVKVDLLRDDPLEIDLKRVLNFGHTLAHPLETVLNYKQLTHGQAVGIGMATATRFAVKKGICKESVGNRILDLICRVGLPASIEVQDTAALVRGLQVVTNIRNGALNLVVPTEIGRPEILEHVDLEELVSCLY